MRAAAVGDLGRADRAASGRRRSGALTGGARLEEEEEEEEPGAHGPGAGQEEEPGGAGRGGVRPSHGGRGPSEGQRLGSHGPHQRPHEARGVGRWPRQTGGRGRLQEAGHQELPRWVRSGEERANGAAGGARARTGPPGAARPALSPRPGPPCSSPHCPASALQPASALLRHVPAPQLAPIPQLLAGPAGPCLGAPAWRVLARPLTLSPHRQAAAA